MKRAEYFKKIYELVSQIPPGRVATYGQLAYLAGFPQAPRIAGQALCFAPPGLPCHRCVNSCLLYTSVYRLRQAAQPPSISPARRADFPWLPGRSPLSSHRLKRPAGRGRFCASRGYQLPIFDGPAACFPPAAPRRRDCAHNPAAIGQLCGCLLYTSRCV